MESELWHLEFVVVVGLVRACESGGVVSLAEEGWRGGLVDRTDILLWVAVVGAVDSPAADSPAADILVVGTRRMVVVAVGGSRGVVEWIALCMVVNGRGLGTEIDEKVFL